MLETNCLVAFCILVAHLRLLFPMIHDHTYNQRASGKSAERGEFRERDDIHNANNR
jgi:hypothetical protein